MPKFLGISGDNDAFVIRHIHIDAFIDRGIIVHFSREHCVVIRIRNFVTELLQPFNHAFVAISTMNTANLIRLGVRDGNADNRAVKLFYCHTVVTPKHTIVFVRVRCKFRLTEVFNRFVDVVAEDYFLAAILK